MNCLIVDDSEQFLDSATRLLSVQGLTVTGRASTGAEALRLATTLHPDVALVDIELGDDDGIVVAQRLSAVVPATTVILISVRDRNELAELLAGSGAAGFLRKDALDGRAIADLVGQRRQRDVGPEPA